MICVSVSEPDYESCLAALNGLEFAEIRLDPMTVELKEIEILFSRPLKLIATCRPGKLADGKRKAMLLKAIEAGAAYVDVEVEADPEYRREIFAAARKKGCDVIVSFHDFDGTPSSSELRAMRQRCLDLQPDIVKIACTAHNERDGARLLGLLDSTSKLVVVGMGKYGRTVRIAAPLLGSPFTYASTERGKETADGQLSHAEMRRIYETLGVRIQ